MLIINLLAKIKYTSPVVIILAILLTFNAFFAFVYKSTTSIGIIASMFETNINETISVFSSPTILIPVILLLAITSFLLLKTQQELKSSRLSLAKTSILLALYFLIILPCSFWFKANKDSYFNKLYASNKTLTIQLISKYCTPVIYTDIITIIAYQKDISDIKKYVSTVRTLPKGISLDSNIEIPEKIYVIIDESACRKHMSLYGYEKNTTPFFDKLNQDSTASFRYYNAISPAPLTRDAFRLILSFATPNNPQPFYKYKNIVEIANDRGYETIWISNQEKAGVFDSYIGNISACASFSYFNTSKNIDDFDLYEHIESKKQKNKKQFFIINLIGSHISYHDKYDSIDKTALNDDYFADHYDRTIHHTDRFLEGMHNIITQDSSYLSCYLSDHGEIVNKGHGLPNEGTAQFEIPFTTLNNSNISLKAIVKKYKDQEKKLINSTNLVYILAEVMGYNVSSEIVENAIEEGKYVLHSDMNIYLYDEIKE